MDVGLEGDAADLAAQMADIILVVEFAADSFRMVAEQAVKHCV